MHWLNKVLLAFSLLGFQDKAIAVDISNSTTNYTYVAANANPPPGAGEPLDGFVSFSIEFAYFPDYAGNLSSPNTFSDNLLNNIGDLTGTKPFIRVGGNTQDYALYNASLETSTYGIIDPAKSSDYPTTLSIGPSFFESYATWPGVRFIHGFNLGKNGTAARESLLATVPLVCQALENGRLAYWELGNEPDLYKTSAQGAVRPASWDEAAYVAEWLNGTRAIRAAMQTHCPNISTDAAYKYMAPSFAGTSNSLDPLRTWDSGLDADGDVALVSSHNYIGGATQPGVTLQGTLMNHSSTVASIAKQLNESRLLAVLPRALDPGLPFVLGETNSLYNEGAPGLSNSFGAALWGVDFNLWCAASGIRRVHMHQGTNYRYASWQPIATPNATKGTKPPYYGNIAVAAFLGGGSGKGSGSSNASFVAASQIANLPLAGEREAAYAAYGGDNLDLLRVLVLDMNAYNATANASSPQSRPVRTFEIQLPANRNSSSDNRSSRGQTATTAKKTEQARRTVGLRRLVAAGSDALSGITFDGYSYNWELNNGLPVLLDNVTRDEKIEVDGQGMVRIEVPWSSAVIVDL